MIDLIIGGMVSTSTTEAIDAAPFNWALYVGVPVAVAIIGALGLRWSHRAQKGSRENAIIDQLQENLDRTERLRKEDLASATERSDKQDARMEKIETRLNFVEKISRGRLEYIYLLRRHINDQEPPPAPDWPPGIND